MLSFTKFAIAFLLLILLLGGGSQNEAEECDASS